MKRAQLIEWGIIVIALIFGYRFFEGVWMLIMELINAFDNSNLSEILLRSLVGIVLYLAAFMLLIRNSGRLAAYFSAANATEETALPIKVGKRSMLQVILIAICVTSILTQAANLIYYLYDLFSSEVNKEALNDFNIYKPDKSRFIISSIAILFAIIVIYFSRTISEFLIPKNEADELVFESREEKS